MFNHSAMVLYRKRHYSLHSLTIFKDSMMSSQDFHFLQQESKSIIRLVHMLDRGDGGVLHCSIGPNVPVWLQHSIKHVSRTPQIYPD